MKFLFQWEHSRIVKFRCSTCCKVRATNFAICLETQYSLKISIPKGLVVQFRYRKGICDAERKKQVNQSLLGFDIPFRNKFKGFEYGIIHSQWLRILEAVAQRCSVKKVFFRNFTKITGKHLCQSHFFNKAAGPGLAQVFSCDFCEISKNTFSYRTPLVAASGISPI